MKFKKEKFLKSEFGAAMQNCIADWLMKGERKL